MSIEFGHEFLDQYMCYVEETESPRSFHVWAALVGIGACLGRRVFYQFGDEQLFANQYVLLVGPPAVRKSTAINRLSRLLRHSTHIRFAPSDTAGQRQGLIKAIAGDEGDDKDKKDIMSEIEVAGQLSMERLREMRLSGAFDPRDVHTMTVLASEFANFVGHNSRDMMYFLIKMYDGENYDYKLTKEQSVLADPLLSLLGGTTPTSIANVLPPETIGQGLMSRFILVYSANKYKSIPRPKPTDKNLERFISERFSDLYYKFDGQISESNEAGEFIDSVYDAEPELSDPRFVYYLARRHTHFIKISMCLAAGRLSRTIELQDVELAQRILEATEPAMPEALGEFGLSPLAQAKQKMLEFVQHAKIPISIRMLYAVMNREMKMGDFNNAISDLINAGRFGKTRDEQTKEDMVYYRESKKVEIESAVTKLVEDMEAAE